MPDAIDKLRSAFEFKRTPMNVGRNGIAFLGFLRFASGDTDVALQLQSDFLSATGHRPFDDASATALQTGEYIDWLIETQWGEAATAGVAHA